MCLPVGRLLGLPSHLISKLIRYRALDSRQHFVLKDEVITIMFGVGFMQAYVWEAISVVAEFMVDVVRVEAEHMCGKPSV